MGDCDIVVHPEDKERAHEVFLRLGFENKGQQGHEWIYYKNDLAFELHHRLLYNERGNTEASIAFCDQVWEYVKEKNGGWVLDRNFHYIFLLLHLHKHLIHMGIGFRQFMDLYAVASSVSLDWSWIDSQLEKMGLLEFSRRCTHLTECWFKGVEMTERDIHCFQQVLQNGVFGYHNESNRKNRKADILLLAKGPHWLTRLHNLLRSIFPTYEKIRYLEYCRALNGRPWLLPFFWVYRWIRAVRFRMFGKVKRVVDETLVSNQELEERRRELSFWDL